MQKGEIAPEVLQKNAADAEAKWDVFLLMAAVVATLLVVAGLMVNLLSLQRHLSFTNPSRSEPHTSPVPDSTSQSTS